MNNNDERDYAEEAYNARLLREDDERDDLPTVRALIIPASGEPARLETLARDDISAWQSIVGGWIEAVALTEPRAMCFVNEEGKIQNLPINRAATLYAWQHGHPRGDVLVGNCLIVGPPDRNANSTDVPAAYVDALMGDAR